MIYLIRHAQTALNALDEVHGQFDDSLDDAGRAQAAALGALFVGVPLVNVYASPLRRAVETAEQIASAAGVRVAPDERLMDRDYGPWTGYPEAQVQERFGSIDHAPGVESWETFSSRVSAGFSELARRHAGELFAVVAHDAVNRALLMELFPGRWPDPHAIPQHNACWNRLERDDEAWALAVLDAVAGDGQQP